MVGDRQKRPHEDKSCGREKRRRTTDIYTQPDHAPCRETCIVTVIRSRSQLPQKGLGEKEGAKMVKKFICGLIALGSFGFLLFAADSVFVGTWKLNVAKSKFAKGMESTDTTMVVSVEGDTTTVASSGTGGFGGAGKPFTYKFTVLTAGGPLTYSEGGPPNGITDVLKRVDDRTVHKASDRAGSDLTLCSKCE
jgi:hypothetical protein